MNEVSKIHLGRQAFTISDEAHKNLRQYLDAIKQQVGDKEVVEEVEMRMAELLAEHGITGDKVILPADVAFLKQQLGNPKDFKEDDEAAVADKPADSKRLFRDTSNAMLAGVAAGLSEYTGIDVLLIRLVFVIGAFTGGWGILLYVVLWILAPEAKTSSDRLQMAGKAVTVDSLKEVVERADIKGAARRANNSLVGPINSFFRFILKLAGIVFVASGLCGLFALIAGEIFLLLQGNKLTQDSIFPVGLREHLLLNIAMAVLAIISILVVLAGIAMFRRKWPIRTWVTGLLIGLIFLGLAGGGALAADVVPHVVDRYNANLHTTVRFMPQFSQVNSVGEGVDVNYQVGSKYAVYISYYDHPNLLAIKTSVSQGVLTIDSRQFDWRRHCQELCIPPTYNVTVTVYSPNPVEFNGPLVKPVPMPVVPIGPDVPAFKR